LKNAKEIFINVEVVKKRDLNKKTHKTVYYIYVPAPSYSGYVSYVFV